MLPLINSSLLIERIYAFLQNRRGIQNQIIWENQAKSPVRLLSPPSEPDSWLTKMGKTCDCSIRFQTVSLCLKANCR